MERPWPSSVSCDDEIGGRRRLPLAIVVGLYEPAGKAASRGPRPGLRLMPADEAQVCAAGWGSTWDRLRRIETQYDPSKLFRLNQNIKP
jgi:hypothetical protein